MAGVVAATFAMTGLTAAMALPASAATVYEIEAQWAEGSATTVKSGDVLTAEWRVNVNDDAAAPSNDPVDNVNFTLTIENGTFEELPSSCLTDGVDPVSSVSDDGKTMVCNIGTQDEGTAHVVQTPIRADGTTGSQLGGSGTVDGITADLDPIEIVNDFGMDIRWDVATNSYDLQGYPTNPTVDLDLQWTLSKDKRSEPGPQTVSYDLTVTGAASSITVGAQGCTPFTTGIANGHPWSGGDHPAEAMVSPVDTCTIQPIDADTFRLTLTGIDYEPAAPATQDSTGAGLPVDEIALASGSIWLRIVPTNAGSITLESSAPTYTSAAGNSTAEDDPANNSVTKTWFYPGTFTSPWNRAFTGSGGSNFDGSYMVSPGTAIRQTLLTGLPGMDRPDNLQVGMCAPIDTQYLTFQTIVPAPGVPGSVTQYYVGNHPTVTPNGAGYDPQSFPDCGGTQGWITAPPADLTTVKAVRVTMTQGQAEAAPLPGPNAGWLVEYVVKDDVAVGQDIWSFMYSQAGDGWASPGVCATPTPGLRYPCTIGAYRDLVRIAATTPYIEKSADRSAVNPGQPTAFSLNYSANVPSNLPESVDEFVIVDTLPAGVTYIEGTATPAPVVTTNGAGQQVLTWTLDGVVTNVEHALTYQAVAAASIEPGTVLTNSATASVSGVTSEPATAQVTIASNGYTSIGKTADAPFIPNPNGDGIGEGSWTVTLRSFDPLPQDFTDTIDILPFNGDERGTDFAGSYELTGVDAIDGATVYYTTVEPATLSDDPAADGNGAAGAPSDIWSTTFTPEATAVRVVGPTLAAGGTQQFTVRVATDGVEGGDTLVNRAQARSEHTDLVMRTSAPITVANYYSAALKKYVMGTDGEWQDANTVENYPSYRVGDEVPYRIVITNTGQGTLTDLEITDTLFPEGSFTVDELAPGAEEAHEFTATLTTGGTVVNTACAAAALPEDSQIAPTINCDPAGIEVVNYTTVKSSDPEPGTTLNPGDEVTYTITVAQEGTVPAVAQFTDDLAEVLDDADLTGGPTASIGTATITDGVLSWNGTVPVGEVATVSYTVTIKDSAALADGGSYFLENGVESPGCAEGGCPPIEHPIADYSVVKSSDPADGSNVEIGDTIEYTVTVSQIGEAAYEGASLTDDLSDVLDDATWNDDLAASAGTVDFDDAAQLLSWTGDLAVDDVLTITYSVTVTGEGDTHLHNVVTSDGCATQGDCETEHYTATYTTVKTSDPASGSDVQIGDVITYTVTVTQSGEGRVVGQFFNDDLTNVLDDATFNNDIDASMGEFTYEDGVIAWSGELGPGDIATVTYSVTVTAAGDTLIGNTVQSPGCESEGDCQTEHQTGRYETVKTSDPATGSDVQIGDTIEYTVTVSQIGEAAVEDASFTDDLTAVLDDATWNDDLDASAGTAGYTEPTVAWSGELAVDAVVTVTYSVTVTGAGDQVIRNVVTSDGCVDEGLCTTTHQTGDYAVSKTSVAAPGSEVAVGDTITYTVTVTQRGPGSVEGASFDDDLSEVLDDATWNGDLNASAGSASFDADAESLAWSGDLAVGAVVTVTYSVAVTGEGDMILTNVALPGENGECVPASDENPDCTTTHETGRFTYSKMADPIHNSDVQTGDIVTYTVTVTQNGPAGVAASVTDDLSDVIDDADYNDDVTATAGTAAIDGPTLTWNGDLAPGDVVTITYSVTVTGAGNTTLANVVTSPSPAGECVTAEDGTEDCRTIHKTGGYVYSKTSDPASGTEVTTGDTVTYTVTVTHRGEGAVTDAIVTDDLVDVLDDARWNDDARASTGAVSREGNTLTWSGDLAVGEIVTVTYSVTVTAQGPAELRNVVASPDERAICDPEGVCTTTHEVPPQPPLAATGGIIGWTAGALALLLLLAGGAAITLDRRRRALPMAADES